MLPPVLSVCTRPWKVRLKLAQDVPHPSSTSSAGAAYRILRFPGVRRLPCHEPIPAIVTTRTRKGKTAATMLFAASRAKIHGQKTNTHATTSRLTIAVAALDMVCLDLESNRKIFVG